MITLEKFTTEDFDRFISWIGTEEELVQFAGPIFTYPLTREQLYRYQQSVGKQPFRVRLTATGEVIGHCELNFENYLPRLSRILIGDREMRNRGLGKLIVRELVNRLFSTTIHDMVDLNVYDWNANAIAAYTRLGFRVNPEKEKTVQVGNATWRAYNMILKKADWQPEKIFA
ncbi:GNAT family protein [Chitinophaga sp. 212800010-3]|uniref:GNAT family N-acetyltransferase n=1 Tax=unclassified Chitinophaga TaxID=2619133 RepID=UPI002DF0AE13|nr:Protein N-acetyltransferase, RimJ/RimL family [Chitinophaga sp. 212800010-3]